MAELSSDSALISFDVEWVPDWIVEELADHLRDSRVKATWFATHGSALLTELSHDPLFEVGLHPNFLPGSTQGDTQERVMETMLEWYPRATSVRTHCLYHSQRLQQAMVEAYGLRVDCSLYLPACHGIEPHRTRFTEDGPWLTRLPHFFQDNFDMVREPSGSSTPWWRFDTSRYDFPGLKVFNFHPLYVILNDRYTRAYEELKRKVPVPELTPADIEPYRRRDEGLGTLFRGVVAHLAEKGRSYTVTELCELWEAEHWTEPVETEAEPVR